MSRAKYLYLITDHTGVYAGFTSAPDCTRYLKRVFPDGLSSTARVLRINDGVPREGGAMDVTADFKD